MNTFRKTSLTVALAAVITGCATAPSALLEEARGNYKAAQANPRTRDLASVELKQAGDTLARADEARAADKPSVDVDHLAYIAKQQVAIAEQVGVRVDAQSVITNAQVKRDAVRLAARTNEADAAQRDADGARRQADESQRTAASNMRQAEASKQLADASQRDAQAAQQRNAWLEGQLQELRATKTARGLLITLGDVYFDTDRSQLKPGGLRNVEKLGDLLQKFPLRRTMVEGFTDSTGSEEHNQDLSDRRAQAVRTVLLGMGVGRERIETHGYGEAHPVADNSSAAGRVMNRRVEILLSDDNGTIAPR